MDALWGKAKASTWNVSVAALRAYSKQLILDKVRTTPLVSDRLAFRKVPKRLPKPVEEDEVAKVLATVTDTQDKLLLEVLAGSGMRRSEIAALTFGDIQPAGIIRVIGKGNKERRTFLTHQAEEALRTWVLTGHLDLDPTTLTPQQAEQIYATFLLQHPDRGIFKSGKEYVKDLTKPGDWVYYRVKKYTDAHPHQFRHFWVTDLLNNGADMMAVMDAAGHESISTTRGYKKVLRREVTALRSKHSREQGRL